MNKIKWVTYLEMVRLKKKKVKSRREKLSWECERRLGCNFKQGHRVSLVAQRLKRLLAMRETWVWSLAREDSPGEGNGSPLQYSCLENPMDRGTWWATVHRVAKSWTRLSDFTFTFIGFQDSLTEKVMDVCACSNTVPPIWSMWAHVHSVLCGSATSWTVAC